MDSSGGVKGGSAGGDTDTPNSNTTGLAVVAFVKAGHQSTADKARDYVYNLRMTCSYATAVRGVVAYDSTRKSEAKSQGKNAVMTDKDRRSTSQAVLGLAGTSYAHISKSGASSGISKLSC